MIYNNLKSIFRYYCEDQGGQIVMFCASVTNLLVHSPTDLGIESWYVHMRRDKLWRSVCTSTLLQCNMNTQLFVPIAYVDKVHGSVQNFQPPDRKV